jgi:hypothetical protein
MGSDSLLELDVRPASGGFLGSKELLKALFSAILRCCVLCGWELLPGPFEIGRRLVPALDYSRHECIRKI